MMARPAWHAEALALLASGVTVPEIAAVFKVTYATAAFAVDFNGARANHAARVRKQKGKARLIRGAGSRG
jgi:hypothetical protein